MKRMLPVLVLVTAVFIAYRLFNPAAPTDLTSQVPPPSSPTPAASLVTIPVSPQKANVVPPTKGATPVTPKPTSAESAWEPTAQQKHLLNEARKDEDDWERQRGKFLDADLKLSESEQTALETLRKATAAQEAALMARPAKGADEETAITTELRANRSAYEDKIQSVLGPSRYKALATFYKDQWKSDGLGAHVPLK